MIFFVSVGELTLYSNIHVHILDCITNALNLCHIAIFPALPNYIMICRHCITLRGNLDGRLKNLPPHYQIYY